MEASAALSRRARLCNALATGTLLVGAVTYTGLKDPHRSDSLFPPCPFKLLTGWNCPACGGLRMTHDLLHGDLAAAVVDNVFLLVALPALAAWIGWRRHRGQQVMAVPMMVVSAVLVLAWTVLRNWPGFPLVPTVVRG
jgi:hypothetical protein